MTSHLSPGVRTLHEKLQHLWTKAVGTPGYDKEEWKELERLVGFQARQDEVRRLTVEQAAVFTSSNGVMHTMPRPARHDDIIRALAAMGHRQCSCCEQGFMLSNGQFCRRKPAKMIALAAGQVKGGQTISETMTSEDLW